MGSCAAVFSMKRETNTCFTSGTCVLTLLMVRGISNARFKSALTMVDM